MVYQNITSHLNKAFSKDETENEKISNGNAIQLLSISKTNENRNAHSRTEHNPKTHSSQGISHEENQEQRNKDGLVCLDAAELEKHLESQTKMTNQVDHTEQVNGALPAVIDGVLECNKLTTNMAAPDGGWGWFIVLASFLIHFIVAGLNRAAGILYIRFEEKYNKPAAITAWVTSLSVSLTLGFGPLASALCNRFSYRSVVIWSGIILASSMFLSGLSPNINTLFATYGVMGGIAKSLAYGPGVVIVGMYFDEHRGIAVGLATSGVALGAFAVPSIVELSFKTFDFMNAFIIMAGIAIHLVLCGALLRPLSLQRKIMEFNRRKADHTLRQETSGLPPTDNVNMNATVDSQWEPGILLFNVTFQSAMIFLPPFSEQLGGIEGFDSFTVVIVGLFDGLGRILFGFLFDRKSIKPFRGYIYNSALGCLGVISFCIPAVRNMIQLGITCAVYGLFLGCGVSQQSVIIVDMIGSERLASGFGILLMFQGIGTFAGPPLSGLLKDINGTYDYAFYFGGSGAIVGALILLIANILNHRHRLNNCEGKPTTIQAVFDTHL